MLGRSVNKLLIGEVHESEVRWAAARRTSIPKRSLARAGGLVWGILLILLLILLAAGCNSSDTEDSMTQGGMSVAVTVAPAEVGAGDTLEITLTVENTGADTVGLDFRTAQRYDFVITDESGSMVWRWGAGQGFAQVLGTEILEPGGALTFSELYEVQLPPGRYTVTGVLAAPESPLEAAAQFTSTGPR